MKILNIMPFVKKGSGRLEDDHDFEPSNKKKVIRKSYDEQRTEEKARAEQQEEKRDQHDNTEYEGEVS